MSIKEIDISVGSESQVAVTTTLITTTDEARDRFKPIDRDCYFEGELSLKYLPERFYRFVNIKQRLCTRPLFLVLSDTKCPTACLKLPMKRFSIAAIALQAFTRRGLEIFLAFALALNCDA